LYVYTVYTAWPGDEEMAGIAMFQYQEIFGDELHLRGRRLSASRML